MRTQPGGTVSGSGGKLGCCRGNQQGVTTMVMCTRRIYCDVRSGKKKVKNGKLVIENTLGMIHFFTEVSK